MLQSLVLSFDQPLPKRELFNHFPPLFLPLLLCVQQVPVNPIDDGTKEATTRDVAVRHLLLNGI
jgi:hypothetical protein